MASPREVDDTMAWYLQDLFFQGLSIDAGTYALASLKHHMPVFKRHGVLRLVRSQESMATDEQSDLRFHRMNAPMQPLPQHWLRSPQGTGSSSHGIMTT